MPPGPVLTIQAPRALLDRPDDYRLATRSPSRAAAARELLHRALRAFFEAADAEPVRRGDPDHALVCTWRREPVEPFPIRAVEARLAALRRVRPSDAARARRGTTARGSRPRAGRDRVGDLLDRVQRRTRETPAQEDPAGHPTERGAGAPGADLLHVPSGPTDRAVGRDHQEAGQDSIGRAAPGSTVQAADRGPGGAGKGVGP